MTAILPVFPDRQPSWHDDALCAQIDPELWFPEKGGSTRQAKELCKGCPVQFQCLQYALDHGERYGIWGGVSERDRRKLIDQRTPREQAGQWCRRGHDLSVEGRSPAGRCRQCDRISERKTRERRAAS